MKRTYICAMVAAAVMAAPTAAFADDLFAIMAGGNQVGTVGSALGRGSASVMRAGPLTICFAALVTGIDTPTEFHIHQGVAGQNGPNVVNFIPPTTGNPGTSSGCVKVTDQILVNAIFLHPRNYYLNVHTKAFPEGAIRGQLF